MSGWCGATLVSRSNAVVARAKEQGLRGLNITHPTKNAFSGLSRSRMEILSGYELFLYQGIHAFQLFTGRNVDAVALRRMLAMPPT
jgi:shikimate 5-dehydrogenase